MPETIEDRGSGPRWHWYNVMNDLRTQGGLKDVTIDPHFVTKHGCGGRYQNIFFHTTWVHDQFLLVTMEEFSQSLVDAFSKVVGYNPFARYQRKGMVTVEWDKKRPGDRMEQLKKLEDVTEIVAL